MRWVEVPHQGESSVSHVTVNSERLFGRVRLDVVVSIRASRHVQTVCTVRFHNYNKKQEMLFSIVLRFGNTWFLLCLERLDADWLNGCGVM